MRQALNSCNTHQSSRVVGHLMKIQLTAMTACFLFLFKLSTQAQETDGQRKLWDSVEKLDILEVGNALDKGADPNYEQGRYSVTGFLAVSAAITKGEVAENSAVKILEMLFKAGAKLGGALLTTKRRIRNPTLRTYSLN